MGKHSVINPGTVMTYKRTSAVDRSHVYCDEGRGFWRGALLPFFTPLNCPPSRKSAHGVRMGVTRNEERNWLPYLARDGTLL